MGVHATPARAYTTPESTIKRAKSTPVDVDVIAPPKRNKKKH